MVLVAGVMLLVVGLAKSITGFGSAAYLSVLDPVFGYQFRWLLLIAGSIEIGLGTLCLRRPHSGVLLPGLAWLSLALVIYRVGMVLNGWHRPCKCLGNLADALHISDATADAISKGMLLYLIAVSSFLAIEKLFRTPQHG